MDLLFVPELAAFIEHDTRRQKKVVDKLEVDGMSESMFTTSTFYVEGIFVSIHTLRPGRPEAMLRITYYRTSGRGLRLLAMGL